MEVVVVVVVALTCSTPTTTILGSCRRRDRSHRRRRPGQRVWPASPELAHNRTPSSSEMEDVDIVADRSSSPEPLQATSTERSGSPEPAGRQRRLRGLEPEAEVVGQDHRVPVDAPEFETMVVEEDSDLLLEEESGHLSVVGANVSASSNSPDDDDNDDDDIGGATSMDEQSHLSVMGIPVVSGNDATAADIERAGGAVAKGATKPHTSLPLRILLSKKKSHEASVKGTNSLEVGADEEEEAEEESSDKENSEECVTRSVEEGALMKAYMEELALKASASNLAGPDKQKHINPFDSSSASSSAAKEATATKPINPFDSSSDDDDDDESEAEDAFAAIVSLEKKKHDGVKSGTNNVSAAISSFEKKKNPIVAKSWSAKDHPVLAKSWAEKAKSWAEKAESLPPTKPVIKRPFHDSESEEGGFPTAAIRAPLPKSTVSEKTKPVPAKKAPIKNPFYDSDSDDEEGIPSPALTEPPAKAQLEPLPEPRKTIAHKKTTRRDPSPLSERKDTQLNLNQQETSKGAEPPTKDIAKVEKEAPDPDQSFRYFPLNEVDADGSMDVSYLDQTRDNQDTSSTHDSFGPQLEMDRYAVTPSQQLLKQNIRSVSFVTQDDGRDSPALADSLTETTLSRHERKESASTGGIVSGFLMNACGFRSPKKPVEQSPLVLARSNSAGTSALEFERRDSSHFEQRQAGTVVFWSGVGAAPLLWWCIHVSSSRSGCNGAYNKERVRGIARRPDWNDTASQF